MYRARRDLLPEYFELWASREELWAEAESASTGTTANSRNRLSEESFLDMEMALPDIAEQQLVVQAARVAKRTVGAAEDAVSAAERLLEAMRRRAWDAMSPHPQIAIGDVMKVTSGGTPSRSRTDYFGGDIPWVKTSEVGFCTITETEECITEAGLLNSSAKLFPEQTVLVAMYGRGTVGRSAILGRPMATNQACAALLPCAELQPRFLFHWLWSHYDAIVDRALGTTNLTNISKAILDEIVIPIPPVAIQKELVARFDACLALVEAERSARAATAALTNALIDGLVSGDLGHDGPRVLESTAQSL